MLKWYADVFRFKDETVTRSRLMRVWLLAILSVPAFPLMLLMRLDLASDLPILEPAAAIMNTLIGWAVFTLCMAALVALCLTRVLNRFWARDRYLDEWEVDMKHASMSFTLQGLLYSLSAVFFIAIMLQGAGVIAPIKLSLDSLIVIVIFTALYIQIVYILTHLRVIDAAEDITIAG